jgi:hypothetical protein
MFQMSNDLFRRENNLVEAMARVRLIAWHGCEPGESTKAALRRVATITGLPPSKVRRYWYGLPSRIDAWALDLLRAKTGYAKDAQKHLAEMRRRPSSAVPSDDQLSLGLDSLPPRRDGSVAG